MKFIKHIKFSYLFILTSNLLLFTIACTPDDISSREQFIQKLADNWIIDESGAVLINGQDITELFLGFELSINADLTYTTNSNEVSIDEFPWPTAGFFELSEDETILTRDDGLEIEVSLSDDENSMELIFDADENTGGRQAGVRGRWRCQFSRR